MPVIVPASEWSRETWRAMSRIQLPAPRIWVHHGASGSPDLATLRAYDRYHVQTLGWSALGYSWAILGDGTIYEGRGWGHAGSHTKGDNDRSHGIVLVGDWSTATPPQPMIDSLAWLVRTGYRRGAGPLHITGGHRDAPDASTVCPGDGGMRAVQQARRILTAPVPPAEPVVEHVTEVEEVVMFTRVDGGSAVYQIVGDRLVHMSKAQMLAVQAVNGWDRWQDHVGEMTSAMASAFRIVEQTS